MKITTSKKQTTKNLEQYAGLWVAFIGKKIISSADTLKELAEKTQKLKIKKEPAFFSSLSRRRTLYSFELLCKKSLII